MVRTRHRRSYTRTHLRVRLGKALEQANVHATGLSSRHPHEWGQLVVVTDQDEDTCRA